MITFSRWEDLFGVQVAKLRGEEDLLYQTEIDSIPGMDEALHVCYTGLIAPRVAAKRYVNLATHRLHPRAMKPETSSQKELVSNLACCEFAYLLPCVCAYSFTCVFHGDKHIGSHE